MTRAACTPASPVLRDVPSSKYATSYKFSSTLLHDLHSAHSRLQASPCCFAAAMRPVCAWPPCALRCCRRATAAAAPPAASAPAALHHPFLPASPPATTRKQIHERQRNRNELARSYNTRCSNGDVCMYIWAKQSLQTLSVGSRQLQQLPWQPVSLPCGRRWRSGPLTP